jgi:hypothetical protein
MPLGSHAEQSLGVPVVKRNEIAKVGVDTPPLIFCVLKAAPRHCF